MANSKLKVTMVGDYPFEGGAVDGGVEAVTYYIVQALRQLEDLELSIVKFDAHQSVPYKTIQKNNLTIHILKPQSLSNLSLYARDRISFNKCLESIRPDVVHAQGAGREGYLAVKSRFPAVVTFHGIIGEDAKYKTSFRERTRFRLQSLITETYCVKYGKHLILISPYVKEYYGSRLRGNLYSIPNPVHQKYFDVVRDEQSHRLLFAGRVIPRKGLGDLIEALARTPHKDKLELVVAGSLKEQAYVDRVKQLIRTHSLENNVSLRGLLSETEMLNEFSKCAALILPSYQETAPMVVQQAMAAGVPVIATEICGIPNQIESGKSGLLYAPGDIDALTEHLTSILANSELRASISEQARTKALREYRAEVVAEMTAKVYRKIVSERN